MTICARYIKPKYQDAQSRCLNPLRNAPGGRARRKSRRKSTKKNSNAPSTSDESRAVPPHLRQGITLEGMIRFLERENFIWHMFDYHDLKANRPPADTGAAEGGRFPDDDVPVVQIHNNNELFLENLAQQRMIARYSVTITVTFGHIWLTNCKK